MRALFLVLVFGMLGISNAPQAPPNPVPIISWISPPSTAPAGPGLTLTVVGSGFVAGSIVQLNGAELSTTFLSADQLTAAISATVIASEGTAFVTVLNPGPGGGVSNTAFLSITVSTTAVVFGGTTYTVGEYPVCAVTGDFNGDGKLDLAVGNLNSATVSILLGNGDGTFGPKQDFATGSNPRSIAVGDFNGDGKLDLAVVNNVPGTVSILLGKGDGTFAPKMDFPVGTRPRSVVVGDFNHDGKLDLAVANHDSQTVSILLGNGDGTFTLKENLAAGLEPYWVVTADFNGDGNLDLAVVNYGSPDYENATVGVYLGDGKGGFTAMQSYEVGWQPLSVAVGDFNGDGNADLAVTNENYGTEYRTVSILLGDGKGSFAPQTTFNTGSIAYSVGAADFNGDGLTDLAVLNGGIMLGNGAGSFGPSSPMFPASGRKIFATSGDFNGDGRLDMVAVDIDRNFAVVYQQVPRASISTHSLNFGSQTVNTRSKPRKVTFNNTGSALLQINTIAATGDFSETNNCSSSLMAETSCTIEITFQPTATGTRTGTVSISNNASGTPETISLTGTGE